MTTKKGRPATGRPSAKIATTPGVLFDVESTADDPQATPAQVRRRRAAADRCPPMDDGRRDPIEPDRRGDRWTSDRTLHVEVGRRTAWLHGGKITRLLNRAGVDRRMWDHLSRTWCIPVDRVDDLLVYAEHFEGRFCTVEAVDP